MVEEIERESSEEETTSVRMPETEYNHRTASLMSLLGLEVIVQIVV